MPLGLTRTDAVAAAEAFGLPPPLRTLAAGELLPDPLTFIFGPAEEFYLCSPEQQRLIAGEGFVPLWDDGSFYRVVLAELSTRKFVVINVEEVFNPDNLPRWSLQQVLLDYFIAMWELEFSESQFLSAAAQFGFNFTREIMDAYEEGVVRTAAEHSAWRESLRSRIDG